MDWVLLAPLSAILSIFFGGYLYRHVRRAPVGSPTATRVSGAIREGANAYLRTLYAALAVVVVAVSLALLFLFGVWEAVAYVFGATC
jgi:K(+)-stimulated pyrophosphate-energized sodium pump